MLNVTGASPVRVKKRRFEHAPTVSDLPDKQIFSVFVGMFQRCRKQTRCRIDLPYRQCYEL
jgi:hypothetical protein